MNTSKWNLIYSVQPLEFVTAISIVCILTGATFITCWRCAIPLDDATAIILMDLFSLLISGLVIDGIRHAFTHAKLVIGCDPKVGPDWKWA